MFLIFCLVNMVMAIDVLMKYALRFLHSMSGCVPVDIKNCTAVACLFYFWLFVWGRQQAGGKRQANIAQAVSARSKTSFVMEFTACCSAVQPIKSLQFPRKALFVPSLWHILAEVIMSQITALNHVRGKRLSRAFGRMTSTWKMSFFSPSMTVTFFFFLFWKRNLKIQINIQRSAFAFCHAWCNVSHSGLIQCTLQPIFIQNIVPAFK